MLHCMVEWIEFGTSVETLVSPGVPLATYREFSWKARRAGLPALSVLMGFVSLLTNQSVTLAAARELFRGNC